MIDIQASHQKAIGCSKIAQVLNLSRWGTTYQLWEQYTGRAPFPNIGGQLRVALGEPMEEVLRPHVEQRLGRGLRRDRREYLHETLPIVGHVDYRASVLDQERHRPVVDMKTSLGYGARTRFGDDGTDQVDDDVLCQMQGYCLLTGAETAYVAALVPGPDLKIYTIQADKEFQQMIEEGVEKFWWHVTTDTPPPITTLDDASRCWPVQQPGTELIADHDDEVMISDFRDLQLTIKELEEEANAIKLGLQLRMFDRERLVDGSGRPLCTWKAQQNTRVDITALKAAGLYEQYSKTTNSRVFRLTSEKKT